MNKKGFTVIELLASFALTMIIVIFLFEIVIELKDIYVETALKTDIQTKTAVISKNIKRILPYNTINTINCEDYSCDVNSVDGNTKLTIDVDNSQVVIGNQKFSLPDSVSISSAQLNSNCSDIGCYLKVGMNLSSYNLSQEYKYNTLFYFTGEARVIDKYAPEAPKIQTIYNLWSTTYGRRTFTQQGYTADAGVNGTWTTSNGDPQLHCADISSVKNISGAYIELESALTQNVSIQIFYNTGSGYSEANSRRDTLKAGSRKILIPLPKNNYTSVRFDIGNVSGLSYKIKNLGLLADNSQSHNNTVTIILSSTDVGSSGIDHFEQFIPSENSSWSSHTLDADGKAYVYPGAKRNAEAQFRAVDKAGNVSNISTTQIIIT